MEIFMPKNTLFLPLSTDQIPINMKEEPLIYFLFMKKGPDPLMFLVFFVKKKHKTKFEKVKNHNDE